MSHDALNAYGVAEALGFASWDSYPTGHIQVQRESVTEDEYRVGNPDNLGLDHDLYRSATESPVWIMEQQPGDINWPPYSPQPADGAMGLWAHYAIAHGADVVFVPPSRDLGKYDAVVAPTLYLVDEGIAGTLEAYVEDGGELVVTMRTGFKDRYNRLHDSAQPGPLASLLGATVRQHESVPESITSSVVYDGETYDARVWNEWLTTDEAETIGHYEGERSEGKSAIVHNTVGDGSVAYVGTYPSEELTSAVVSDLLERAGVETTERLPTGVRVMERDDMTWVGNFTGESVTVDVPEDSDFYPGGATIEAYDIAVTDAAAPTIEIDDSQ